jgi:hypothetical protein
MPVCAQLPIRKGTQTIGGSVGGSYDSYRRYSASRLQLSIRPDYGYFIRDNFCIGASVVAARSWFNAVSAYTPGQHTNSTSSTIGVGPFLRYYYPIDHRLYAVAAAHYTWVYNYDRLESDHFVDGTYSGMEHSTYTDGTSTWGLAAGFSYLITPEAALETTLGFDRTRDVAMQTNIIPATTNRLSLNIGFRFFLLPN